MTSHYVLNVVKLIINEQKNKMLKIYSGASGSGVACDTVSVFYNRIIEELSRTSVIEDAIKLSQAETEFRRKHGFNIFGEVEIHNGNTEAIGSEEADSTI
jgi:hypothetical protein